MTKCSIENCEFEAYDSYKECILHCSKEKMSSLGSPYFTKSELFYDSLIQYIAKNINQPEEKVNVSAIEHYLKNSDDTSLDELLNNCEIVF